MRLNFRAWARRRRGGVPAALPGGQADAVAIRLPATACVPVFHLGNGDGRDQIATQAREDWSAFERPLPAVFHACARRLSGLAVDVGANSGFYALLAAASAPRMRVLAFEPDPPVHRRLLANIERNGFADRIAAHPLAISDREGTAALYVPTQEHGLLETSSSLEEGFKDAHSGVRQVPVATLDGFLGRRRQRRVALIKVDVEGHEASVLRGACRTVRDSRPLVFVEVLPRADCDYLTRFLSEHGYVDVPLPAGGPVEAHSAVRFHPAAWNHAFVPAEQFAEFARHVGSA